MNTSSQITLGELVDRIDTWNPARSDSELSLTYIDLSSIDRESKQISGEQAVLCSDAPSRARQLVQTNDVLVSTVRPNLNGVALVPDYLNGATASTGFCVLRPRLSELDASYLFHWVKSPRFIAEMTDRATGASYPAVTDRIVRESKIPLPPLSEQKRIAAILDQADALCTQRRATFAKLDELTQSIFLEMFGDPAVNPKRWEVTKFEDEFSSVRYGTGSPPPYVENGIPFIRATNIKNGTVTSVDLKHISRTDSVGIAKCRVHAGDLIIVRSGVNTGDCAVIPEEYDGAFAAFDLIVKLPAPSAVFYSHLINSNFGKKYLEPLTRRAAQPHLNAAQVKGLQFISPPMSLREQFKDRVNAIGLQKEVHTKNLLHLDFLFSSLQHRAFSGTL